jgi:WS/DGAT/MGAT family acyltransferase
MWLTAEEASILSFESSIQSLHGGGVMMLDAAPLRDAEGRLRLQEIRDRIASRLYRVPRSRQRIDRSALALDLGSTGVWRDDDGFDIAYHVRHSAVPFPGDEGQLLGIVNRVIGQRLDPDRPLWELWFLEGVEEDRVAVVHKTHPLLMGQPGAIDLMTAIIDASDSPPNEMVDGWQPAPLPGVPELAARGVVTAVADAGGLAKAVVGRASRTAKSAARGAAGLAVADDSLPWQQPLTAHRRFETVRVSLDSVLHARELEQCSVNDVLLAAISGALRTYLEARDFPVTDLDVDAVVPLAHAEVGEQLDTDFTGGRVRLVEIQLPVGEGDPAGRLDAVAGQFAVARADDTVVGAATMVSLDEYAAPTLLAQAARATALVDNAVVVVNVPGSRTPRCFLGAAVLEVFPYLGIADRRGLTIAVQSHGDQLTFGLTGDRSAMPDLDRLASFLQEELANLF